MPTKPQNPSKIYYLFASSQGEDLVEEKRGDEHRAKFLRRFRAISHAHISESLQGGALRRLRSSIARTQTRSENQVCVCVCV